MDYEKLFPGRFIKAADLDDRDVHLKIRAVRSEEIDGKAKAILGFQGTKKEMVMNRTNAESIKLMFGRETDKWIGEEITIFPATIADPFNGGTTSAIRVKGSRNLTKPATATVQRGKKTIKVTVIPTGKPGAKAARKPPLKAEIVPAAPPHDEETGEVFDGPPSDMGLPGDADAPWAQES